MKIEHFDQDSIIVKRTDTTGPARGLTATYIGIIKNGQVNGSVTYWAGPQSIPTTNTWTATILKHGTQPIPSMLALKEAPLRTPVQRVVECEGPLCNAANIFPAVWDLKDDKGIGQFTTGDQPLTVEHLDSSLIVVRREDTTGPAAGLTATYMGSIEGRQITGNVIYQGKTGNPRTGPWYGVIEDPHAVMPEASADRRAQIGVPANIIECEGYGECDGTWTFSGLVGKGHWTKGQGVDAILKATSFGPTGVRIEVSNTSTPGLKGVYTGRINENRITGTVLWQSSTNGSTATVPWSAVIPAISCVRADGIKFDTQEALDVGRNAQRFKLYRQAKLCYLIGANRGDPVSQYWLASVFFQEASSPETRDYPQIFAWTKKAADKGFYFAERDLATFYKLGLGTSPDASQSDRWATLAMASPSAPKPVQAQAMSPLEMLMRSAAGGFIVDAFANSDFTGENAAEKCRQQAYANHASALGCM